MRKMHRLSRGWPAMHVSHPNTSSLSLRRFIGAAMALWVGSTVFAASREKGSTHDDLQATVELMTESRQDLCTPTQAFEWLKAGNERFRTGRPLHRDHVAARAELSHGQYPFASVLSCMDSRSAAEIIFDAGLGDIFDVRLAGNVVNDDVLGSLEYAHKFAGAKLLIVLGHSHCGAVKGAIDDKISGNLTGLLSRIRPAITAIPSDGKPRTGKNDEFVDRVGRMNVIHAVRAIRERSPLLRDLQERGQIDIIGAFYDIETGKVEFYRPLQPGGGLKTTVHADEVPARIDTISSETTEPAPGHDHSVESSDTDTPPEAQGDHATHASH